MGSGSAPTESPAGAACKCGAGRGNDRIALGARGLDWDSSYARFHERVEVVLRSWREERLTHDSVVVHVRDVEVLPKPL